MALAPANYSSSECRLAFLHLQKDVHSLVLQVLHQRKVHRYRALPSFRRFYECREVNVRHAHRAHGSFAGATVLGPERA